MRPWPLRPAPALIITVRSLLAHDRAAAAALVTAAAVVLASRAAFLPPTLEDIDSVNFALALDRFDPRLHQPHPPGYPVYVAAAKLAHLAVGEPARTLALLSAVSQALAVIPLFLLLRALSLDRSSAALAALVTLANPMVWFTGARPMSDSFGLLWVLTTQVLLLRGREGGRALAWGSLAAGLAPGVRLQAAALVVPLWLYVIARRRERRPWLFAAAGVAAWALPLLAASGGIASYAEAFTRVARDAMWTEPLITGFTFHRVVHAASDVLVAPWSSPVLGVTMTVLALAGLLDAARRRSPALTLAVVAFAPYLVAHSLFQEVRHLRYAVPYIPFVAWLAVQGAARLAPPGWRQWCAGAAVLGACAHLTLPSLAHYHGTPSPPYAAFAAIGRHARPEADFMVGAHFTFFRYMGLRPPGLGLLPPVPGRGVLSVTDYWRAGGTKSVLFLADRSNQDVGLIDPEAKTALGRWEWPDSVRGFTPAARPTRAELLHFRRPTWFVHEGWSVAHDLPTPTLVRHRKREAFLAPRPEPSFLLISGEPQDAAASRFSLDLDLDGIPFDRHHCGSPLLQGYLLPGRGPGGRYVRLTVTADGHAENAGAPFALRGFAYGARSQTGSAHGRGWHSPEADEQAMPFRWIGRRAETLVHVPKGGAELRIEGTAPLRYLRGRFRLTVEIDATRRSLTIDQPRFRIDVPISGDKPFHKVILSVDRSFVPSRVQATADVRELAVRIYEFRLEPRHGIPLAPAAIADGLGATPGTSRRQGGGVSPSPGLARDVLAGAPEVMVLPVPECGWSRTSANRHPSCDMN